MPELVLSAAVDCCTTISIWVNVKEITADGKYSYCIVTLYDCRYTITAV